MEAGTIVTIALLLLAELSIAFFVRDQIYRTTLSATQQASRAAVNTSETSDSDAELLPPDTKVVAYHFHWLYPIFSVRKELPEKRCMKPSDGAMRSRTETGRQLYHLSLPPPGPAPPPRRRSFLSVRLLFFVPLRDKGKKRSTG